MNNKSKRIFMILVIIILFTGFLVSPIISGNSTKISNSSYIVEKSFNNIREIENVKTSNENLTIFLKPMFLFLGVKIEITNNGDEQLKNINWNFKTTGGYFIRGGKGSGTKTNINPGETISIRLLPLPFFRSSSPVGLGNVEIEATAKTSNSESARTTAEAIVLTRRTIFFEDQGNTAKYKVTFNATWSQDTHPDDFPLNPHFSGLIGASHSDKVNFWEEGKLASSGIKNMAEKGSKSPLNDEINTAIREGKAFKLLSGEVINPSPGSTSLTLKVSKSYPLVSLVTMIAPSPDWFVGVNSLNLFKNGAFVEEKTVILYAYDAGTDSGTNYTSPDEPTNPPVPIFKIETSPFVYKNVVVPLGNFTFTKID